MTKGFSKDGCQTLWEQTRITPTMYNMLKEIVSLANFKFFFRSGTWSPMAPTSLLPHFREFSSIILVLSLKKIDF